MLSKSIKKHLIWRPQSLSELTPMIFNTGLTHLALEASICVVIFLITKELILIFFIQMESILKIEKVLIFQIDHMMIYTFQSD